MFKTLVLCALYNLDANGNTDGSSIQTMTRTNLYPACGAL